MKESVLLSKLGKEEERLQALWQEFGELNGLFSFISDMETDEGRTASPQFSLIGTILARKPVDIRPLTVRELIEEGRERA